MELLTLTARAAGKEALALAQECSAGRCRGQRLQPVRFDLCSPRAGGRPHGDGDGATPARLLPAPSALAIHIFQYFFYKKTSSTVYCNFFITATHAYVLRFYSSGDRLTYSVGLGFFYHYYLTMSRSRLDEHDVGVERICLHDESLMKTSTSRRLVACAMTIWVNA